MGLDVRGTRFAVEQRIAKRMGLDHFRRALVLTATPSASSAFLDLLHQYARTVMAETEVEERLILLVEDTNIRVSPDAVLLYLTVFRMLNNAQKPLEIQETSTVVYASALFKTAPSDTAETEALKKELRAYVDEDDAYYPEEVMREAIQQVYLGELKTMVARAKRHDWHLLKELFWRAFMFAYKEEATRFATVVRHARKAACLRLGSPWSALLALVLRQKTLSEKMVCACHDVLHQPTDNKIEALWSIVMGGHKEEEKEGEEEAEAAQDKAKYQVEQLRLRNPWPNGKQLHVNQWRAEFLDYLLDDQHPPQFTANELKHMLRYVGGSWTQGCKRRSVLAHELRRIEEGRMQYICKRQNNGIAEAPHVYVARYGDDPNFEVNKYINEQRLANKTKKRKFDDGAAGVTTSAPKRRKTLFASTDPTRTYAPDPNLVQCPMPNANPDHAWLAILRKYFDLWLRAQYEPVPDKTIKLSLMHLIRRFEHAWKTGTWKARLDKQEYETVRRHLRGEPPFVELPWYAFASTIRSREYDYATRSRAETEYGNHSEDYQKLLPKQRPHWFILGIRAKAVEDVAVTSSRSR